ncbi:MAG: alginate export family protein [Oleiphilaceae bacterium]|nr:alginate export family protein [Oleiphilaceae bacterium]
MSGNKIATLALAVAAVSQGQLAMAEAATIGDALAGGKAYGDFRMRVEMVDQDNALKDAEAATIRTRLGYTTAAYEGVTMTLEMEDSRSVLGQDDFNSTQNGKGQYSVVADPDHTELDQAFLSYGTDDFSMKLGRQVITLDNHRFVGHVGWRQDRQTFDALTLGYTGVDSLSVSYSFVDKRNRIFAEAADVDSRDHLLNIGLSTPVGKVTAYGYLLEDEDATNNALDTYGLRFAGNSKQDDLNFLYQLEYAKQSNESGTSDFDTDYMLAEAGLGVSGITVKLGYEVLGSDDGNKGFATPLATLHKFNGWADQFLGTPNQGLEDMYVSVGGKLAGGAWLVAYHDFSANESTATIDDLGSEVDLLYKRKFAKYYNAGIKYAAYSAGDAAAGKVDTDKLWLWVGASF